VRSCAADAQKDLNVDRAEGARVAGAVLALSRGRQT
jgi:hypothetical protein